MVRKDALEVALMMLQTFGKCCKGNLGVGSGKRGQRFSSSCPDRDLFMGPSLTGVEGTNEATQIALTTADAMRRKMAKGKVLSRDRANNNNTLASIGEITNVRPKDREPIPKGPERSKGPHSSRIISIPCQDGIGNLSLLSQGDQGEAMKNMERGPP